MNGGLCIASGCDNYAHPGSSLCWEHLDRGGAPIHHPADGRAGGPIKRASADIERVLEMLHTLNSIGALDGLVFAAVRSDGEKPVYGRVCSGDRAFELLGALHCAAFAFADRVDEDATVVYDEPLTTEEP